MAGTELEAAIKRQHQAGDMRGAVELALDGYARELMGFLFNRLRDADDAAEVFSRVCEDIWRGIAAFRWHSSFRTWMYVLARNAAHRYQQQRRRDGRRVGLSQISELVARHRTTTLVHLRTEAKDALAELRATLDPDDQTLLLLRVKRALSWNEVALVMEGAEQLEADELARAAARYRQRFAALKRRLKQMAREAGLLG